MFEETFLKTAYNNSIKLANEMFSNTTILGTNVFSSLHDRILGEMGYEKDTSQKATRRINLIADELFGAIAGRFFARDYNTQSVRDMFFGDNTIAAKVLKLKNSEQYKKNPFLKLLNPVISEDEKQPNMLTLFNATENRTKWHKDRIIEGWQDLLADPDTHELAHDLVAYSFYSSGFRRSLHSFYNYIPPAYLKEIGYVDFIKNSRESLKDWSTGQGLGTEIYNDVMKNTWHNSEIVPYIAEADISHKRPFEGKKLPYYMMVQVPARATTSDVDMKVGENAAGDPIFRAYFKTTSGGGEYTYRYVGFRESPKTKEQVGVYVIEGKRGIQEPAGRVIKEYGLQTSIYDANNVERVSEDEIKGMMENAPHEKQGKTAYNYEGFQYIPTELMTVTKYYPREDADSETELKEVEPLPNMGINISSYEEKGKLGQVLSNLAYIPVVFNGVKYATAEEAYQTEKKKLKDLSDPEVLYLMTKIITAKLQQNPGIWQSIAGMHQLNQSTHNLIKEGRVVKGDRWTGKDGLFMQALRAAYMKVELDPSKAVNTPKSPLTDIQPLALKDNEQDYKHCKID
jgi:hypothetical protein